MQKVSPDLICFGHYKPAKDHEKPDLIGRYQFLVIDESDGGGFAACPTYSADVIARDGRTLLVMDWGDVPSPKAGRALDLHRAAAARIRDAASKLKASRVYFINDAGKVEEGEESALAARLRQLLTVAPEIASASFVADARSVLYPHAAFASAPVAHPAP